MSLWLCLRLPRLPLEALLRDDTQPVAVLERQRVVCANDAALALGIDTGQSASTARALAADEALTLLERDPAREQETLCQLQNWAYSTTPSLCIWRGNSLQLELGRCLRLHGAIEPLVRRLELGLSQRGFSPIPALAENREAAWVLTFADDNSALEYERPLAERLAPLPIDCMPQQEPEDHSRALISLQRAGFHTLGELLALPSAALRRRCGRAFGDWLARVAASSDDVCADFQPAPQFHDALWFGFDIRNSSELEPAMAQLLDDFCAFLRSSQLLTSAIEWQLLRPRAAPQRLQVHSSSPHREAARWLSLSLLPLERLRLEENIEGLALHVEQLTEEAAPPSDLFSQSRSAEPLHNLIDRLRNRLGLQAVQHIDLRDAHLPEFSQCSTTDSPQPDEDPCTQGQRPFWLMAEPQPLQHQGDTLQWNGPLSIIYGPERIEDNWWQQPVSRDYYIARQRNGQPIWLFQDRHNGRWYVQGILP